MISGYLLIGLIIIGFIFLVLLNRHIRIKQKKAIKELEKELNRLLDKGE